MSNQRFRLNYTETDKDSGDTTLDLDITFENPDSDHEVIKKINTFLAAAGFSYLSVGQISEK